MEYLDEELKYITLYETPETDEALEILARRKQPFVVCFWACLIITVLSLPLMFINVGFGILSLCFVVVNFILVIVSRIILKPYRELYLIAVRNDRVRHEERVRFKEHMRLEKEFQTYKPTKKQIENTLNLEQDKG